MDEQEAEKTRRKRERNRIAAAKCREKKINKIHFLEQQTKQFKEQLMNTEMERDYYKGKCNEIVDLVNSHIRKQGNDVPISEISKIIEKQNPVDVSGLGQSGSTPTGSIGTVPGNSTDISSS